MGFRWSEVQILSARPGPLGEEAPAGASSRGFFVPRVATDVATRPGVALQRSWRGDGGFLRGGGEGDEKAVHQAGGVPLKRWDDVAVDLHGGADLAVAEYL